MKIYFAGITELPDTHVKNTLEYLDNLDAESNGDISLQSEVATAYQKVGDFQGNPYRSNLGNIQGAIASYRKSLAIREKLVAENPSNDEMRRNLANSYESIGDMFWTIGEYGEALKIYRQNLQIYLDVAKGGSASAENSFGIARASHRIGQALSRSGDTQGAMESFLMAQTKFQESIDLDPQGKYKRGMGSSLVKIGDMFAATGDWKYALEYHQQDVKIASELSVAEPLKGRLYT